MMAFTSPEDLMKNLPKATSNISRGMGEGCPLTGCPTFKISMRDYEDMAIKVGDKITIEIKKSDIRYRCQTKSPESFSLSSYFLFFNFFMSHRTIKYLSSNRLDQFTIII
jgi:hypothetical protein